MRSGGAGNRTTDVPMSGQPVPPLQSQQEMHFRDFGMLTTGFDDFLHRVQPLVAVLLIISQVTSALAW